MGRMLLFVAARFVVLFLFLIPIHSVSYAHEIGEAEFLAASLTGEDIALWVQRLQHVPRAIGLFSIRAEPPLDPDFANVVEGEIAKNLESRNISRVVTCPECRTSQIQVLGERIVVTRSAPDLRTLQDLGKKLGADAFLVADVYRTQLSLISQVNLYDTLSGQLIGAETFKVPALEIANAAMQLMIKAGPGFLFGGGQLSTSSDGPSAPPFSVNLLVLEELGFGKGGINVGGVFNRENSYGYVMPTLGWRGRFGGTSLSTLKSISAGYGFRDSTYGVAVGLSYDVFFGSFAFLGLQATGIIPIASRSTTSPFGFAGINIGLSLGR